MREPVRMLRRRTNIVFFQEDTRHRRKGVRALQKHCNFNEKNELVDNKALHLPDMHEPSRNMADNTLKSYTI